METLSIRILDPKDEVLYSELFLRGLELDERNFRIAVEDCRGPCLPRSSSESFTLGGFYGDRLVGIVSFEREGSDRVKARHKGRVYRMLVDASYRSQGVARLLLTDLLRRIRDMQGLDLVTLTVMSHNDRARSLYESFGFRVYGTEPAAVYRNNEYRDEDLMVLDLRDVNSTSRKL